MKLFLFNNDEKLIGTVSPLEGIQNEEINKIQTIECITVYSELIEKASYIGHKDYSDSRIFHLYKIDHVTKTSTTDVKIVGVHTFFDDMESDGYVKDFRPTNREVVGVLTTILDGSRWQLGSVNVQRNYTGNFYYVTRKEAISKLIEATQIEIKPRLEFSRGKITGRYLDVFTRLGGRNGKVFVHGRDLLTVSEKKSQGAIYTAVVGRGKGEETDTGGYGRRTSFKDVVWTKSRGNAVDKPAGQEYVEIPAMTKLYGFEKGTKPRIKIVEFQDETDKEKLLRLSYEWLEKNSRMQVEYSAKVLNVGNLELGDTVGIFNLKLGIKYETRVFKVKRNLVNNKLTEFGIGDKVTTSPFSRTIELAKEMKNFQDDTVYWLDKIRERLSDKLINEDGYNYDLKADNEYKVPAGYYSFDKPIDQNPTKVVYMGAGKIAIANSKKPTGEWNWKTFLDGNGATLDLINTGVLRAGRIQSADGSSYWDLDSGEFHLEQSAINEAVKTVVDGKAQEIVGDIKKNLPTKEELKGTNSYIHKKYSDFEDGRNMSDNSTLKYIGIYTGDKEQAPTNASEYSWTKIKGEDGKSINENLLPNSNFNQGFTNWEDKLTNSGLNYNFDHAITHFGRGLHIYGTANAEYKGFSSVPFNLIAKQGDKLTLSMDLGKDALTQNAPLKLALHYIDDKDIIVGQEWQTLDLATQNFEVKKYKRISRVFTVGKDIRKCRVIIYATNGQLIDFYIDNIKLERGEVATEWSPAYEDLQAHSLTANLRFEGRYVNNIVTDLNTFVDVFYDGQKITEGFELKVKHKGMGASNWTDFISRPYDNTGRLTNFIFSNGEKDGTPLEAIVLVTYKGLNTITNERIENVPDVTEIKETVKKYKILESTLDRFNSTIGQVKEQVVNGNRNYITNSGSLNDKSFGSWNKWEKSIQNGTIVFTKINGSDNVGFFINFTELVKTEFQNETMTWSIDVRASRNCTFNRIGFETNGQRSFNLTTQWQRISHTFVNKFTNYFAFTFYNPTSNFNNDDKIYIRFPKLEKGNVATEWTVAPEDVSLLKETTETSIEQTNRNLELKVSKDNVIASINASVEKNAQGQNQGVVKIKGEVLADNIHGKTFTGSKFEVGKSGFLDSQGNNLRISAPHDWNGSSGVGMQLRGKTEGDFNQGLNIYRVNDVRNPNSPLYTPDETALTVFGEIRGAFKINSAPRSGKILSRMGRVVMSNISSNNPVKPDGYSGQLLQITGIFLKYGGGPTQLWVNDGTGSNSTFGVNLTNMESDIKLKENISISNHSGLEVIEKFTFHSFDWKEDKLGYKKPHTKIGLIAQEVQEIQEDLVYKNPNALALDEFRLLNISLKAIQELSTENQQLKSQLKEMNERLTKLEDKINGNI